MQNRKPKKLRNVIGDGACLPRTISLAIFGVESHHQRLRDAVVEYILQEPLPGETAARDANFYQRMEKMRQRTEEMTTLEITTFAHLLDTPIFTCVECVSGIGRKKDKKYFWQRLPHEFNSHNIGNDRGIYIYNAESHFQLVLDP